MTRLGIEPRTYGLKVRCSTNSATGSNNASPKKLIPQTRPSTPSVGGTSGGTLQAVRMLDRAALCWDLRLLVPLHVRRDCLGVLVEICLGSVPHVAQRHRHRRSNVEPSD